MEQTNLKENLKLLKWIPQIALLGQNQNIAIF